MAVAVEKVDVLIIGAGPAGLTAANCFKGSQGLRVQLIDRKNGNAQCGKADGLKSISLEIFDTFGVGDIIRSESHRLEEIVLWEPGEIANIVRAMTIPDRVAELGKPREVTLDQGRIEHHLVSSLAEDGCVNITWNSLPTDIHIDCDKVENVNAYPITVQVRNASDSALSPKEFQARYLIACDGAHSWTRKELGISLRGDLTDSIWGVMDIVPKTNFPDVRKPCVVHSAKGTLMTVPREGKLVRFYVSMAGVCWDDTTTYNGRDLTLESIVAAARTILSPYTFEAGRTPWWSVYRVGQRVADSFSKHDRVFLAGDAVHTHSPKAGQGMNTSIQDAYNIGWKLRCHLEHGCSRSILSTYEEERRPIAQELIDFDREYLELFSNPQLDSKRFLAAYLRALKYTTGIEIRYSSYLAVKPSSVDGQDSSNPPSIAPGKRLPDFQMVNQADGVPVTIHRRLVMTGCFRILVFAGDVSREETFKRLVRLGEWLTDFQQLHFDAEIIVIHSTKRADVDFMDFPEVFRGWTDQHGYNYWGIYTDDESYHDGNGNVYERCGLDRNGGCLAVVRPDGYVSLVCGLEEANEVNNFFNVLKCLN